LKNRLAFLDKSYGEPALNKFESKIIEEGWLAENEWTQAYIDNNEERLRSADQLLLDFTKPEVRRETKISKVVHDFGMRYE